MVLVGLIAMLAVGISLGLIGGGGSILTVPILVYLFGMTPEAATGYSLFVVGVASIFGGVSYYRADSVDVRIGILFAVPSIIGTFLSRRFLVPSLPEQIWTSDVLTMGRGDLIMLVFAMVMIVASVSMIRPSKIVSKDAPSPKQNGVGRAIVILGEGLLVGLVTGFVGAGGGFLVIPALVVLARLPMKVAIGTSLWIIAAKSLVGFSGDLLSGSTIDWTMLLLVSAIAVFGIFAGTAISRRVDGEDLKKGFGWFVLVVGGLVVANTFL